MIWARTGIAAAVVLAAGLFPWPELSSRAQQPSTSKTAPPPASETAAPPPADTPGAQSSRPAGEAPAQAATEASSQPAAAQAQKPALVEAKKLFAAAATPSPLAARSIGFYARGCLAGAEPVPVDGPAWQVVRLSRNRNWGHPALVKLVEQLAAEAKAMDGWPGLLIGDISQPRGGPMLTGHASHQVGLDADIWLTPMPNQRLSEKEREELPATSMLGPDEVHVDPKIWTTEHARLILRAASYPQVERIFVHPGIKKAMCAEKDIDRKGLRKVQPYWGHHYHFHVRIHCPPDSPGCTNQPARPADDGCGKEVDDWIKIMQRPKAPPKPLPPGAKPAPPRPGLTVAQLPPECKVVLETGSDIRVPDEPAPATPVAAGKAGAIAKKAAHAKGAGVHR